MDRDSFLKDVKRRTATFEYVTSNGEVKHLKGKAPTVAELRQWRKSYQNADGSLNIDKALKADEALLAIVLLDDDNQPMMSMADVYEGCLNDHDASAINKLCTQVSVFCGIDPSELRDIRDAAKNLYGTQKNESSGNSQPAAAEA